MKFFEANRLKNPEGVVTVSDLKYTTHLWLTCDHFVRKVSAMRQPIRPTQPSIPPGSVNE